MKAITLLSGGLDSMVSTAIARERHKIVLALTFDYGQRAAKREILAAKKLCRPWKIPHKAIKLPWLGEITNTALVNTSCKIPTPATSTLQHFNTSTLTAQAVWVPNRNAVFINIAAAFAEALKASLIVTGFNKEEGRTFPDNSRKFVSATNRMLRHSTLKWSKQFKQTSVVSFVQDMTKVDMVRYAICRGLPIDLCWPCYKGGKKLCGRCESCVRFFKATRKIRFA